MDAKYMNLYGWSDVHPYEIIRWVSEKTVEIRAMQATLDPSWKPEFIPGGFAAHCTNQSSQRYTYESDPNAPVIRARLGKKGWKSKRGMHKPSEKPRRFYDYNF
jgi:hypothetical protein